MSDAFETRPLRLDDMEEAARVHRTSFDHQFPWLVGRHTPTKDTWFFREQVFPQNQVHGAAMAGRIVGIIAFTAEWINQLYVLPDWQGRGIGSSLLARAQVNSTRLQLWTFQRNVMARRFYERHGFVAVEMTDGAANEEREPDVLYVWSKRGSMEHRVEY